MSDEPIRGRFFWNPETRTMEAAPAPKKKLEVNAPYVQRDEVIGGIESPITGKIYDSKSNLRREYKRHGMIEKGNDRLKPARPQSDEERAAEIRAETEKTFYDLKYGRIPVSEVDQERNRRELRALKSGISNSEWEERCEREKQDLMKQAEAELKRRMGR